jgi:hypothetical protein
MPLKIHGEKAGTITFYFRSQRAFGEQEIKTAEVLATLAAAAVGNAELYEEQLKLREEAEAQTRRGKRPGQPRRPVPLRMRCSMRQRRERLMFVREQSGTARQPGKIAAGAALCANRLLGNGPRNRAHHLFSGVR